MDRALLAPCFLAFTRTVLPDPGDVSGVSGIIANIASTREGTLTTLWESVSTTILGWVGVNWR